jgi:hypothetical protein
MHMPRTMRAGFLGAFPGDGTTHPIIKSLALELERKMPDVCLSERFIFMIERIDMLAFMPITS